jgi:hypothetical protein
MRVARAIEVAGESTVRDAFHCDSFQCDVALYAFQRNECCEQAQPSPKQRQSMPQVGGGERLARSERLAVDRKRSNFLDISRISGETLRCEMWV